MDLLQKYYTCFNKVARLLRPKIWCLLRTFVYVQIDVFQAPSKKNKRRHVFGLLNDAQKLPHRQRRTSQRGFGGENAVEK